MSNPPHGSSGGSPLPPYISGAAAATSMYRRSSYSSVLAGVGGNSATPPYPLQSQRTSSQLPNTSTASGTSQPFPRLSWNTGLGTRGGREADGENSGSSTGNRDSAMLTLSTAGASIGGILNGHSENAKTEASKPAFFIPTYLRGSRYAERLEEAHKASLRAQQENRNRSRSNSNPPSLSTSSSSVSLPHKPPSHRGITHDIIERAPPPTFSEESLAPLPSTWSETDKSSGLDVFGSGRHLKYTGISKLADDAAAVRADHPMPRQCGIYYYEVQVMSKTKEGLIGIGFSGPKVPLNRLPGWEPESWAYHGDDGFTFQSTSSGKPYGPKYSAGDVIGCGINFRSGFAFFTKNGNYLGKAFEGIKTGIPLYPAVGMKKPNEHLSANFGQEPFVFDIDNMIEKERWSLMEEINQTDVTKLHTPLNAISKPLSERQLLHKLVAQYLAHEGHMNTAHLFAQEVSEENTALANGAVQHVENLMPEDDLEAEHRQRIRHCILDGYIDDAIHLTEKHFPKVLRDNENIYFRLRCRKYIEMIREAVELADEVANRPSKLMRALNANITANGRVAADDYHDVFDHQMELDEQLGAGHLHHHLQRNGTSTLDDSDYGTNAMDVTSDESQGPAATKREKITQEALRYGQALKADFDSDPRKEIKRALDDTLALIAYADPRESPLRGLLEEKERVPVAEELNGAILVAQGKSAASALERAVQQTIVLLNELGEDGGVGAFLNVRTFLQGNGEYKPMQY